MVKAMRRRKRDNKPRRSVAQAPPDTRSRCRAQPDPRDCPRAGGQHAEAAPRSPASWGLTMAAAAWIVLSTAAVYCNSLSGPFVYDDVNGIVENRTIRRLWSIGQIFSPPSKGETVTGRPLLNLSLAINYAISGLKVWSYHVTNLLIHIAAALLLFGILRRTLLLPGLRSRFGQAATPLALACALLWALHPLQTESVSYIVQRAESLAGFFYLLTLYCVIRGAEEEGAGNLRFGPLALWERVRMEGATSPLSLWERVRVRVRKSRSQTTGPTATSALTPVLSQRDREMRLGPRPLLWCAAAVLACLLGMATKEVMVTAPLMVLLYDRTFLAGSFAEALRRRWGLYLGLTFTWVLLACLLFSTGLIGRQAELGSPDAWGYARTQPGVILHYLRLSFWPSPLCMGYEWPLASGFAEIVPAAMALALLVAATAWGLMRRKPWGFLGAWFFLILAPTSSVLPLNQLAFEHRMYLSLAAVVVLVLVGAYALCDRLLPRPVAVGFGAMAVRWTAPVVVWTTVLAALGCTTVMRNRVYRSKVAIWQHAVDIRPQNPRVHNNFGIALAAAGRTEEAVEQFQFVLRLNRDDAEAHNNLGSVLAKVGKVDEAIQHFRRALRLDPDCTQAYKNLGDALVDAGRPSEAIEQYQEALRQVPDYVDAYNNLGNALVKLGRADEAIGQYQAALRLKPDYAEAHNNLAKPLADAGRMQQAIEHWKKAIELKPDYAEAHYNLGNALLMTDKPNEAIQHYREALRLMPDYAKARYSLALALDTLAAAHAAAGRFDNAVTTAEQAAQWAELSGQAPLAKTIRARLELYRAGRAYPQPLP